MAKRLAARTNGGQRQQAAAWSFPKSSLEASIEIPKAIEEKNAGKPIDSKSLARIVGFNQSGDWRYRYLLRSANMYGLVDGSGATVDVSLTELGESIVAPSSPDQRKRALAGAFNNVDLFRRVAEFYSGKKLPEDEYFANTLSREFDVERERIEDFIAVFSENLRYLRSFGVSPSSKPIPPESSDRSQERDAEVLEQLPLRKREFLDVCFVLMPFGGWYDRRHHGEVSAALQLA